MNRYLGPNATVVAAEANTDWMERAACKGKPTALFFGGTDTLAAAKAMCRDCPVFSECLAYSLTIPGTEGVWAGMDENERRRYRDGLRRRRRSA